jgi:hypothetical protein
MPWLVRIVPELHAELTELDREVRNKLVASAKLLEEHGPQLERPYVDSLKGSKHANLKELRFEAAGGAWRVAFAFDPGREAVLLAAGDKSGGSEDRFYRRLIRIADARYTRHLERLHEKQAKKGN